MEYERKGGMKVSVLSNRKKKEKPSADTEKGIG